MHIVYVSNRFIYQPIEELSVHWRLRLGSGPMNRKAMAMGYSRHLEKMATMGTKVEMATMGMKAVMVGMETMVEMAMMQQATMATMVAQAIV